MCSFIRQGLSGLLVFLSAVAYSQEEVLTQHNDLGRTGWNSRETILNTRNVRSGIFGKQFTYSVDDEIYAQPLVASGVNIPGSGNKDVVYVATVNNSVYAFDANGARSTPYWQVNLTPAGTRPPNHTDMIPPACGGNYTDFLGNIGIVGTPVINKNAGTLYLVARGVTPDGAHYSQYLHALDLATGAERSGSPVLITARVNGTGEGNVNGVITFDSQKQNQRPGLLLLNGIVYIAYASHCDWEPYSGWLLGYDATTLQQKMVYNTTPDGYQGGIWMSASAPSADESGNIYVTTGNGMVGTNSNPADLRSRSESLVRLTPSGSNLNITGFFTPKNYLTLEGGDLDFGVTEPLLIPNSNLLLTGSKDGSLYLMDRNNPGGYDPNQDRVFQRINLGGTANLRSSFAYYKGATREFVYTWSENAALKAFPVDRAANALSEANAVISGVEGPFGSHGAFLAVSSNGAVDSTAILWTSHAYQCDANSNACPGILRAIAANDVTKELWNSSLDPNDVVGNFAKFVCPTIANGKVYLATFSRKLQVYGLNNGVIDTCKTANIALNKPATASSQELSTTPPGAAVDGDLNTRWSSQYTDNEYIFVDLGSSYNLCRVVIHWAPAYGKDYDIQVSDDAQTWATIQQVRGNTALDNVMNLQAAGRYVRMQGVTRATSLGYSILEMEVYGALGASCPAPTGLTAGNLTENGVNLTWQAVGNAAGYTIQYRPTGSGGWTTATSNTNAKSLSGLSCGTDYLYKIATNCPAGQGAYSASAAFSTSACSKQCGPLPTRWHTSDIGNVQATGSACYDAGVFTLQGSGSDIGDTADAFRFAYRTRTGDDQLVARIAAQDATDAANKAGIMVRESNSPGARNVYIALTSGQGVIFQYRTATGSMSTTSFIQGPPAPYWLKMVKSGSRYSGYASPNGTTWTQVGTTVDLGFGGGNNPASAGFAVSSHLAGVLSTAVFDHFNPTSPTPDSATAPPQLFPNPAQTSFTIQAQEVVKEVRIYDITGRLLLRQVNADMTSTLSISCAGLATGMYIVQTGTANKTWRQKLFKR